MAEPVDSNELVQSDSHYDKLKKKGNEAESSLSLSQETEMLLKKDGRSIMKNYTDPVHTL